jgi:hypothetical protein
MANKVRLQLQLFLRSYLTPLQPVRVVTSMGTCHLKCQGTIADVVLFRRTIGWQELCIESPNGYLICWLCYALH